MKFHKRNWKKITIDLNSWVDKNSCDKSRILKVEHTGLFPTHVGGRGPNHNETGILNFETRLYETKSIHIAGSTKGPFANIFINSTVQGEHRGTYLELRKGGKTYDFTLYDNVHYKELPWQLKECIGPLHEFIPDEYSRFAEYRREDHNNTVVSINSRTVPELIEGNLPREFEAEYSSHVTDLFQKYAQIEFKEQLEKMGIKILVFFRFTHELSSPPIPHHHSIGIHPSYIKTMKYGIELGWYSTGTYNSLPSVVRIVKAKGLSTVRLDKLGLEQTGYYDHHYNCEIPKDQAKQAQAFFKRRFA